MFTWLKFGLVVAGVSLVGASCSSPLGRTGVVPPPVAPQAQGSPTIAPPQLPKAVPLAPPPVATVPTPAHAITVLPVPFTPQAPLAKWSEPYQDACEEASMLIAAEYFKGNKQLQLNPTYADKEILKLVAWEGEHDYATDVTAAEVVSILADYYHLQAQVVPFEASALRQALLVHKVVIVPAAGRSLGNPYFTAPGPLYHMLVVNGFAGTEFITNDPGTKRGENYRYNEGVLAGAAHDWNGGDVTHGQPLMVVVGGS